MNKKKILKLADVIENSELDNVNFHMDNFIVAHACGTSACIAGYSYFLFGTQNDDEFSLVEALDISEENAVQIALPTNVESFYDPFSATPAQAASLLRHFAETGKVDWPLAMGVKQ